MSSIFKKVLLGTLAITALSTPPSTVQAEGSYPRKPDSELTPGKLCTTPSEYRYPEKISYCERDVSSTDKWSVINLYMKKYNFVIGETNRSLFKIDHYIPLCMGGANAIENLWPQHQRLYEISDALEEALCEQMVQALMKQAQAVELIKKAKADLSLVPVIMRDLRAGILKTHPGAN